MFTWASRFPPLSCRLIYDKVFLEVCSECLGLFPRPALYKRVAAVSYWLMWTQTGVHYSCGGPVSSELLKSFLIPPLANWRLCQGIRQQKRCPITLSRSGSHQGKPWVSLSAWLKGTLWTEVLVCLFRRKLNSATKEILCLSSKVLKKTNEQAKYCLFSGAKYFH